MPAQNRGRVLITGSISAFIPGSYQAVYVRRHFSFSLPMLCTKSSRILTSPCAVVAKNGFDAMMKGQGGVVSGWQNKIEAAAAHVIRYSEVAAPGTAKKEPNPVDHTHQ
jgi:uncharacterized protein